MGFLSLIIALLLEQVRPLQNNNVAYNAVRGLSRSLERNFNAGESQHGVLAWLILVVPVTIGTWLVFFLLVRVHVFLGLGWDVLVLYLTLGFRQFSHFYTDIQLALANNDLAEARRLLTDWRGRATPGFSAAELNLSEISRIAIEEALLASHRHVFGVFFWFVVLPGPSGAVLYRLADYLARAWRARDLLRDDVVESGEPFGRFAHKAFWVVDWLPVRLTAVGFAIVGNFEDAVFAWRNHASQWQDGSRGIILASGSGALGVRLGDAHSFGSARATEFETVSESIPGVEASPAAMRSAVGLVWRSLILWLVLLFLLSAAGLFG
jgi:adenosylcobinamide-phosphate synthase